MYEDRQGAGSDLDLEPSDRRGMVRRISVHLPVDRSPELEDEASPLPVFDPGVLELSTPQDLDHPTEQGAATRTRQDEQIESAVVDPRPSHRIEAAGVLPCVRDHRDRGLHLDHVAVVDGEPEAGRGESEETPNRRKCVGEVADRTGPTRGEIVHHVGIETHGRHQDHHFGRTMIRGGRCEIDPSNLAVPETPEHLLRIRGHLELAGEEILVARREVDQWNVRASRFRRRGSNRPVPADDDQAIVVHQRRPKPAFGWFGLRGHQDDLDAGGDRGPLERNREAVGPPRAGDRVEDHQGRHRGPEDTAGSFLQAP